MIRNVYFNFYSIVELIRVFIFKSKSGGQSIFSIAIFNLQFIVFNCYAEVETIQLNTGWQFKETGDAKWFPAAVPGTVHTDLLNNKIIPDPFYGDYEKKLQWIDTCSWDYETFFDCDREVLNSKHVELLFEGLDTYAKVFLNDSLVLSADNMFRTWKIDCKKMLKEKKNHLLIQFESAVRKGKEQAKNLTYALPGEEKVFTRKAAYHYGWDWGPRFVTCGIWRPVKIISWSDLKIESVQIIQHDLSDTLAHLTAKIELNADHEGTFNFSLSTSTEHRLKSITRNLLKGMNIVDFPFEIHHPKRWWCNGLGEPFLYEYIFAAGMEKELFEQQHLKFGLRTLELVQEKDTIGKSFYFKLNGIPVFMKGANYIPADNFLPRVTVNRYLEIIESAVDANMNMLRVWGGGVYEDDQFYNFCDEKGILVWQDFMFACAMYPGDSGFVENVKQEIIDNVKRLRNHPCIALWCGNNEIDEGWHNWDWQKQYHYSERDSVNIWNDYRQIFLKLIPNTLDSLLPSSPERGRGRGFSYWSSSPSIGWGHKQSLQQGDSHYWGVWWGLEPFEIYKRKVGRFMSEYGFQGMPSLNTFEKFCDEKDLSLNSDAVKNHQKHPIGYETIQAYLEREYKQPKDFESYIYVSQLLQAEGIRTAIETHRRAKPYCMGTLYWQLNDCWPVTSWSSTDYYGEWKALHYAVRNAYQDIMVSPVIENRKLKITAVNDKQDDVPVQIKMQLMDFSGNSQWNENKFIDLKKNSAQEIFSIDTSLLLKNCSTQNSLFHVELLSNGTIIGDNSIYFTASKNLKLPKPNFTINPNSSESKMQLFEISSDVLAKNVYLSYSGKPMIFSNNFFDMLPGKKYLIWSTKSDLKNVDLNKLTIKSLADSY